MAEFHYQRITIIRSQKPSKNNLNEELKWFGRSIGLFGLRDKDKSCYRVFVELLRSARAQKPLTSDEIAYRLKLSRGTVVHHLNKLIESGVVMSNKNQYMIRVDNLAVLVDELEKDMERAFSDLREVARIIDSELDISE